MVLVFVTGLELPVPLVVYGGSMQPHSTSVFGSYHGIEAVTEIKLFKPSLGLP